MIWSRENNKFELLPETHLGRTESINGNYIIEGNKINEIIIVL